MRVVGAGFGRTGTTSLKAALEELGFGPSYSLSEVFANPQHVGFWEEAVGCHIREKSDWEGFFAGYGVAVDWPACSFYEELMEAFPEAPVILTVRDPAPWYESMRSTIYELRRLTTGPLPVRAAFALAGLFARASRAPSGWRTASCGRAPLAAASRIGPTRLGSSSATTRRSAGGSRRNGCWSSTCERVGRRCATSSASKFPTSPSRASTRRGRCGAGSSA